jgi:hypothetical protein
MPKIAEAFSAGSITRDAALHKPDGSKLVSGDMRNDHGHDLGAVRQRGGKEQYGGPMRNIVDQADEIIAIAPWSGQNDANDRKRTSPS